MSAPETWYLPRSGARAVGLAALTVALVCVLGYIGIIYVFLYPEREFGYSTLVGRAAFVLVLGLCASLSTILIWYRPKASTCPFGLAALAISLVSALGYGYGVMGDFSAVPVEQIGRFGIGDWIGDSVMLVVIVGSGVCPLIILLSFALDVIAFIDRLQAVSCELPFQRQRNQQLLPHQPQTRFLHGAGVVEELDVDVRPLSNPPGAPAGLP
jgi:hypothetical protein